MGMMMRAPNAARWPRRTVPWALVAALAFAALPGCSEDDEDDKSSVQNLELVSKFVYVTSITPGTLSGYVIDPDTGGLTPVDGSPYSVGGTTPRGMTTNPEGTRLYVATSNPSQINVFDIDSDSGELTELAASPFASEDDPIELAMDADGKFLYCACRGEPSVATYAVDSSGGLSLVQNLANAGQPYAVALDLSGQYVFIPNRTAGMFYTYFRIPGGGGLASVAGSPLNTGSDVLDVAVHPVTGNVYVLTRTAGDLYGFEFDDSTGALTAITGSPWTPGFTATIQMAISPDGKHLYVADDPGPLFGFSIEDDGQITALSPPSIATTGTSNILSFNLDGSRMYAVNQGVDTLSIYSRNATSGALSQIAGSPIAIEDQAFGPLVVNQYE